jgi:hypothetical protein
MYRRSKGHENDDKSKRGKKGGRRRIIFEDHSPLTPLEYFVYLCSFVFVVVFSVMQGIFLYKLQIYQTAQAAATSDMVTGNGGRILQGEPSTTSSGRDLSSSSSFSSSSGNQVALSNHDRIQLMTNLTRRPFQEWPPLDSLVNTQNGTILGDPQFLLDFALIGFEKCGTYC